MLGRPVIADVSFETPETLSNDPVAIDITFERPAEKSLPKPTPTIARPLAKGNGRGGALLVKHGTSRQLVSGWVIVKHPFLLGRDRDIVLRHSSTIADCEGGEREGFTDAAGADPADDVAADCADALGSVRSGDGKFKTTTKASKLGQLVISRDPRFRCLIIANRRMA